MKHKKAVHGTGFFGGFLGILITGCPSCTIWLASFLGVGSMLSLLPREWLELKMLALIVLIWSNWKMYKNLLVCNLRKKKT
jgi:hypothetical protein